VLVVFAKAPQPGRVKTRLSPPLTAEQAADLYTAMLSDVLAASAEFSRALDLDPVVAVHPWDRRGALAGIVPSSFRVIPQRGVNLAARMGRAVLEAAAGGARRILLRGSDSPTLTGAMVGEALTALSDCDVVLRPDLDGGYSLVGLRRPVPGLFDHPMSADSVLADTVANARRRGLRTQVAAPSFDIDTAADLRHLAAARVTGLAEICPRTVAFLDEHALWPSATPG
jgi:rSAM/selenodomain-associated transferase 1